MNKIYTLLATLLLVLSIFFANVANAATVYLDDFGTTTISTAGTTYTPTPNTMVAGLSSPLWTTSTGVWVSFAGATGQALAQNGVNGTRTWTLTFTVAAGKSLTINNYLFWRQASGTGATNYAVTINGVANGSGTIPTTGAAISAFTTSSTTNLTGTVTIAIALTGGSNGTTRLDNFTLDGTVNTVTAPEINLKQSATSIATGGSFSFGSVNVGTSAGPVTFTIENLGTATLNLTSSPIVIKGGTFASDYTVVQPAASTVASGGSTTFTVDFTPGATGARAATITIANNDADEGSYVINLSGTGTSATNPEINLKQSTTDILVGGSYNFSNTILGQSAGAVTFTIENLGTATLNLSGSPIVAKSGTNAADFTIVQPGSTTVAAGGSTTFTINFTPSAVGARTASISITNDDSNENPYTFTINGTCIAPEINLKQSATSIVSGTGSYSFGTVSTASSSGAVTFTIENLGTSTLNLSGSPIVAKSGTNAADFTIVQPVGTTIVASGTNTFTINFTPGAVGARTATISIANDDADENPYTFTLNGTGQAPCLAPSNQATSLGLSGITFSKIDGSFTGTTADGYLVVRATSNTLTQAPVDGTPYVAGNTFGNATVVSVGTGTTFSATSLSQSTHYYFYVFAYNSTACLGGPIYKTPALTNDATTAAAPYSAFDNFDRTAGNTVGVPSSGGTAWTETENAASRATITGNKLVIFSGTPAAQDWVSYDMTGKYSTTYNNASSDLVWIFNLASSRSAPSGFNSSTSTYGTAFVLGATNTNFATAGNGYAVILGQTGTTDNLKIVRYSGGLMLANSVPTNLTDIAVSTASYSNEILNVRVEYSPTTKIWKLYQTTSSGSAPLATAAITFTDPTTITYSSPATSAADNNSLLNSALPYSGLFWNHATATDEYATIDNLNIPNALAPPTAFSVTGGTNCASTTVGVASSETGVNYQLVLNGTNTGSPVAGTGSAISFGAQTTAGTYTVVGTGAGGNTTMTGNAIVNANPTAFSVSGGTQCGSATVGLTNSTTGVNYQLKLNGTNTGSPVAGSTGNTITFGSQSAAGTYTVLATNATTGCTATMTGNAIVNANPSAFNVTGGTQCGSATLGLGNSTTGVNYQLKLNGTNTGSPVAGSTGNTITFGSQSTAGTYTVLASDATTGCTITMTGNAIVNANPSAFSVTGGTQCGSATVGLSNSTTGVNYQLKLNGTNTGSQVAGSTGNTITFGSQSSAGTYTVLATNASTGCTATMTGNSIVNTIPGALTITPPSATVVSGGSGVSLTASSLGATGYAWSPTTGLSPTSGATLTANPTSTTTYTVTASNASGCTASNIVVVTFQSCATNTWTGSVSTDWFDVSNWTCGIVPASTTNVLIPTGATRYPSITGLVGQTATANNITIQSNASVSVQGVNNVNLEIYGNLTNNGTASFGAGKIIIKGSSSQTLNGNSVFKNLEIANSNGVSIASGAGNKQQVDGVLTLKTGTLTTAGNLTIGSSAAGTGLIDNFTGTNGGTISGNLTVERYVNNPAGAFYYIGAPVGNATITDWNADFSNTALNGAVDGSQVLPTNTCDINALQSGSPYAGLFDYRENAVTNCNLQGWHTRFSGTIPNGQGFVAKIPNGTTIDATGTFNNGTITSPTLTRSSTNGTGSKGFNLVANPYAAPIDWLDVAAGNSNIQGVAYVYESAGALAGTYLPLNAFATSTVLGTSQSFFVDVTSAPSTTISFTSGMRRNSTNNFLRTGASYDHMLTLDISGNGFADKAKIAFGSNFTTGFDREYDARKMHSREGQPNLFVTEGNDEYAIYAQPSTTEAQHVPVSFVPGAAGMFAITANDLGTFDANTAIILEDLKLHVAQNLVENSKYTFMAEENDNAERFVLHFADKTTGVANTTENNTLVIANGNDISVTFGNTTEGKLTMDVTDVMGRKIIATTNIEGSQNKYDLHLNNIAAGCYFVHITGNNFDKVQKVILGNVK